MSGFPPPTPGSAVTLAGDVVGPGNATVVTALHNATLAPVASPVFTGSISFTANGDSHTGFAYRNINGDDNVILTMGTGQAVTDLVNQAYIATMSPQSVNTAGNVPGIIGFNIGQWIVTATDGAAGVTRTGQMVNCEFDFIQFAQTGGTAIYNNVVNSRFRFAIPTTGVTIVDNRGIDFVIPNPPSGTVTNYIAINIPAMTGGGGTNFYGILFRNAPAGGSLAVAAGNDLIFNLLGANVIRLRSQGADAFTVVAAGAVATGTVTGNTGLNAGTSAGSAVNINLSSAVGAQRSVIWNTGATHRWQLYADGTAEGGANAGSDFTLQAYSDAGSALATPYLTIRRSDGRMRFFDGVNFFLGSTTGTQIGTATSQLLAFHGATAVVQRAGAAQAAVVTTGSALASYGYTQAQADSIVTLLNEIRAALVEKGLIKGAA